jgi:hypothetical protein
MVHAAPVVRQALRRRLGINAGMNQHNQDAENILGGGIAITNCADVSGTMKQRLTTFFTTAVFYDLFSLPVSC